MKSRQLNFFITPEDREEINKFLAEKGAFIFASAYIKPGKNPVEKIPDPVENIFQIYLTKKEYVKDIKTTGTENVTYFSPVEEILLEFSLGGFYPGDRTILQSARFYFIEGFWDKNEQFVFKPDEFINWSTDIMSTFKKRFLKKHIKGDFYYYSESAKRWIEENNAVYSRDGQSWKAQ